jgi:hypothetical protein
MLSGFRLHYVKFTCFVGDILYRDKAFKRRTLLQIVPLNMDALA